ncbi:hypothetical protein ACEPAI_9179 [Sanghuangporus weigelae]
MKMKPKGTRVAQNSQVSSNLKASGSIARAMPCSSPPTARSRSNSKRRARHRPRYPNRSPATHKFPSRRSNASIRSQIPGAFLPAELLLRIFHLGAELCDEFPVVASQVCSHWRFLILHSPRLWQVVRPDGRRNLCTKRIQRARGQPLHVEIALPPNTKFQASALVDIHSRMACVLPAIRQWRSLSMRFDVYSPFLLNSTLSGLCTGRPRLASCVPELESLALVYPANDDTKEFHLFGGNAPKLRHVTLHGVRLRWSPSLFENLVYFDYTHHSFSMGHGTVREVLAMLSVSKNLRTLRIGLPDSHDTDHFDDWLADTYASVELCLLQKLTVRVAVGCNPAKELNKLFSKLVMPSLSVLQLDAPEYYTTFSRKAVKAVLLPFLGHPTIEQLIVGKAWNHRRCIDAFARSLPNLISVEMK